MEESASPRQSNSWAESRQHGRFEEIADSSGKLDDEKRTTVVHISKFPKSVQKIMQTAGVVRSGGIVSLLEIRDVAWLLRSTRNARKQGNVSLRSLPKQLQKTLFRFDLDGSGNISPIELARAADMYEDSKKQSRLLLRVVLALFVMVVALSVNAVLTYMCFEMTSETAAAASGLLKVKGTDAPVANAAVASSASLFDAVTLNPSELKAITSLTISNPEGTKHYGYTITGYTKDAKRGEVIFFGAQGEKVLCSASRIRLTARCMPVAGNSCTGRTLVELSKSEVEASRILSGRSTVNERAPSGRHLSSSELRRLQMAPSSPSITRQSESDPTASLEDTCPDGFIKIDGACVESCAGGYFIECPTDDADSDVGIGRETYTSTTRTATSTATTTGLTVAYQGDISIAIRGVTPEIVAMSTKQALAAVLGIRVGDIQVWITSAGRRLQSDTEDVLYHIHYQVLVLDWRLDHVLAVFDELAETTDKFDAEFAQTLLANGVDQSTIDTYGGIEVGKPSHLAFVNASAKLSTTTVTITGTQTSTTSGTITSTSANSEPCLETQSWDAGQGNCSTYSTGGPNADFCGIDHVGEVKARQVCIECGFCTRTVFTVNSGLCYVEAADGGECLFSGRRRGSPYGDNEQCEVTVDSHEATELYQVQFDTEEPWDILSVNSQEYSGDGNGLLGVLPEGKIYWSSDSSGNKNGWRICSGNKARVTTTTSTTTAGVAACENLFSQDVCVEQSPRCEWEGLCVAALFYTTRGDCYIEPGSAVGLPGLCLYSGRRRGSNYGINEECSVAVNADKATPIYGVEFDTESNFDTLTVNGDVYSGLDGPEGVVPSGTIYWVSDGTGTRSGWRICSGGEPDVDECSLGTHNCDVNATCTNTDGSFTCACNSGYLGFGVECRDINECAQGIDGCHVYASCVNTAGSFYCDCASGLFYNGERCEDIDECLGDVTCPVDAICLNNVGSFACACKPGYEGDGTTDCLDIDECSGVRNDCHVNASCMNKPGSFACECNAGFRGNGEVCRDIDECDGGHNCHSKAECTNTVGSFTCQCSRGYKGNGSFCEAEDCDTRILRSCTEPADFSDCTEVQRYFDCIAEEGCCSAVSPLDGRNIISAEIEVVHASRQCTGNRSIKNPCVEGCADSDLDGCTADLNEALGTQCNPSRGTSNGTANDTKCLTCQLAQVYSECVSKVGCCANSSWRQVFLEVKAECPNLESSCGVMSACSSHSCSEGFQSKPDAGNIFCAGETCTHAECCVPVTCTGHVCGDNLKNKSDMTSINCSSDRCTDAECCERAHCGEYSCGAGLVPRKTIVDCATVTCTDTECCTQVTCTGHLCGDGLINKQGMVGVECAADTCTDTECCDQVTCSGHSCGAGLTGKPGMETLACAADVCTDAECCDQTTTMTTTTTTATTTTVTRTRTVTTTATRTTIVTNTTLTTTITTMTTSTTYTSASSRLSSTTSTTTMTTMTTSTTYTSASYTSTKSTEVTCRGYSCGDDSDGMVARAGMRSIICENDTCSESECCEQLTCSEYSCGDGFVDKPGMVSIACANDTCADSDCCDEVTCKGYSCGVGLVDKSVMASIACANDTCADSECCDEANLCANGLEREGVCCDRGCGACGGTGCSRFPGGKDRCCMSEILNSGRICNVTTDTVCALPQTTTMTTSPAYNYLEGYVTDADYPADAYTGENAAQNACNANAECKGYWCCYGGVSDNYRILTGGNRVWSAGQPNANVTTVKKKVQDSGTGGRRLQEPTTTPRPVLASSSTPMPPPTPTPSPLVLEEPMPSPTDIGQRSEVSGCQCPMQCPPGQEACYYNEQDNAWECEDVRHPFFRSSTKCVPRCAYKRDAATANCLAKCQDPYQTEVPEGQLQSQCPVRCPDLRQEAEEKGLNATELWGDVHKAEWLLPTARVPATQVVQMLCPKLCEYGHVASYPDFVCPSKCVDSSGADLVDPDTGKPVFVWPGQRCPEVCSTGALRWGDMPCPIFCPGKDGNPIKDELTGLPLEFMPIVTGNVSAAEVLDVTCPHVCSDGSVDLYGLGCAVAAFDCPGKPRECGSQEIIQAIRVEDCPFVCETLRNCGMNEPGLIYPSDEVFCPQPCYDSLTGALLMTDASRDVVYDWGSGCPQRCPAIRDDHDNEITPSMLVAGLESKLLINADKQFWWLPPTFACPLVCLDSTGHALTLAAISVNASSELKNQSGRSGVVAILPLAEKYDKATDKITYKAITGTDSELRARMCPIKCPNADYFLQPDWVKDADGFWHQTMLKSEKDCPVQCADSKLAWPAYQLFCESVATMSAI